MEAKAREHVHNLDLMLYVVCFSVGAVLAYAAWHDMPANAVVLRQLGMGVSGLCFAVSMVFGRKLLATPRVLER